MVTALEAVPDEKILVSVSLITLIIFSAYYIFMHIPIYMCVFLSFVLT